MRTVQFVIIGILAAAGAFRLCDEARAGFTVIGPTPYLSRADSPFSVDAPGARFWVEDFEDEVPTTGLWQDHQWELLKEYDIEPWLYRMPGNTVDADDGAIDGAGVDGFAAAFLPIDDRVYSRSFNVPFYFDPEPLGGYPTAVGLVITAAEGDFTFGAVVIVFDTAGETLVYSFREIVSASNQTDDDFFLGFTNPNGITNVLVGVTVPRPSLAALALDHLQYGFVVPEAAASTLLAAGLLMPMCWPSRVCFG